MAPSSANARHPNMTIAPPTAQIPMNHAGVCSTPAISFGVRKTPAPMIPPVSSSTESINDSPRTNVGLDSEAGFVCEVLVVMELSDPQFVGRFQWSPTAAADYRGTVSAGERVADFLGALGAIQQFRLGLGLWRHAERKCSIDRVSSES